MPSNGTAAAAAAAAAEEAKQPLLDYSSTAARSKYGDGRDDDGLDLSQRLWIESKKLWHIVGPSMFSRLATYSMFVITQAFAGHLGDHELAAVSIASNVVVGFNFGLLVLLHSLVCAGDGKCIGNAMRSSIRGQTIPHVGHIHATLLDRPIHLLHPPTPSLPLCLSDPKTPRPTLRYRRAIRSHFLVDDPTPLQLRLPIPPPEVSTQIFFLAFFLCDLLLILWWKDFLVGMIRFDEKKQKRQKFLQSQLKMAAIAWVSLAALVVHAVVSWLFVYRLKLDVVGVAVTLNFSWWVLALGLFGYTVCGGCPLTWTGFSIEAFSGLWEFVKLSVASGVMLCMNINGWEMMIPLAFFAGTGVRVANELGAGNGKGAKFATTVSVMTSVVIGVAIGSGWQAYVAYINLGCYYLIGVPLGFLMGWIFDQGVMGIWAGMIFGGTAVQTLILAIITMRCDWEKEAEKATAHVNKWANRT
ncbi:hypothetical protein RHGRI_030069 [Rhododendron griersonianum]|uniref:Protein DETOXIFICATION n=1 Tax=Rhododendron griersonianum TaxID=479676 RepID=A0AAV6IRZ8_9ERIC|nr:hypothetical protein RHGRI_030069 [Rhododendron griersonianum]